MRCVFSILLLTLISAQALAGDLRLSLTTTGGAAVRDAVAMLTPAAGASPAAGGELLQMAQRDIAFDPFVLIVPRGVSVGFPNRDKVRHHVYSFSKARRFELKLYGRDETRTVAFDTAGPVAMGCNIHDSMRGFIRVVDTPHAAKSNGVGEVTLAAVPAGRATVVVWHPYLAAPANEVSFTVDIPPSGTARKALTLALKPPR